MRTVIREMRLVWFTAAILFAIYLIIFIGTKIQRPKPEAVTETSEQRVYRFMKQCPSTPIRDGFEPVIVMRNTPAGKDGKMGHEPKSLGIARMVNDEPIWVVCTGHTFHLEGAHYVVPLRESHPKRKPWMISSVNLTRNPDGKIVDRAIAMIGHPVHMQQHWKGSKDYQGKIHKATTEDKAILTSSITGEKHFIVGVIHDMTQLGGEKHADCYIIDYVSLPGESGSCFYGKEKNDFYTVIGNFWLTEEILKENQIHGPPRMMAIVSRWRLDNG